MECRKYFDRTFNGIGDYMTKTKIASVGKASNSIRTVIPMWIAEIMELKKGDELGWKIIWDSENNTRSIEIIKVK
tara:strand:+ start:8077 stop:8301 length:225 start_codon:yes stop_codon:yes gene_type:complete